MTFLTKIFLTITLLFSCSSINNGYFSLFYENWKSDDLGTDEYLKNTIPYSFIRVNVGKRQAIFVLSKIDDKGYEYWIGASMEKIVTLNGLIYQTHGLDSNFFIQKNDWNLVSQNHLKFNHVSLISINNPDLNSVQMNQIYLRDETSETCFKKIVYERTIKIIGFSKEDYYCQDEDGQLIESYQHLFPLERNPIHIKFHYQYN